MKSITLINRIVFFSLALLLASCVDDSSLKIHIVALRNINNNIPLNNWIILYEEADSKELRYLLKKNEADTIYYLRFRKIFYDSIFNPGEDYYLLMDFDKEYKSDSFRHFINQGNDTNYYYKAPLNNTDSLFFIVGKYYYIAITGELSAAQLDYYYQNEDSLKKVRGNELPDLPVINKVTK